MLPSGVMQRFEYKVVPAPRKGLRGKGVKGAEARFANALQTVMNELGAEGWEYQRTDCLPAEERQGLTGRTTVFQNMLVFRRPLEEEAETAPVVPVAAITDARAEIAEPRLLAEPLPPAPVEDGPRAATRTVPPLRDPRMTGKTDPFPESFPARPDRPDRPRDDLAAE